MATANTRAMSYRVVVSGDLLLVKYFVQIQKTQKNNQIKLSMRGVIFVCQKKKILVLLVYLQQVTILPIRLKDLLN